MNTARREKTSDIFKLFLFILLFLIPVMLPAQDVSIWDFRIPETKYQRLTGSLSGGWDKMDYNNWAIDNHSSNLTEYSRFQSALTYDFAKYSESNSLEIGAQISGRLAYQNTDGSYSNPTPYYQSKQSRKVYNVEISPDIRYSNYLIPDTWFWFAEGSGNYYFDQNTDNYYIAYSDGIDRYDSSYTKSNSWNASIGGGIGYGKLRDGSAVFAVLRILDKLTEDSVFNRSLTKDEVLQIVDVFAKKTEYVYTQEKYIKYFMEDIFKQLQEMGVLKENIATAYSVLRAIEVLSEQIEPRLFGWRARMGIQRRFTEEIDASAQSDAYSYTTNYLWHFHDYVSLSFEYGYPITLNLQVNSSFSLEVPRIDYQRKIDYRFGIAGIYQIGERIDATVSGSISRTTNINQRVDENEFIRNAQYSAGVSFRFYIENNINFNVSYSYTEQYWDSYSLYAPGYNVSKQPSISFGVNYRFL